MAYFLSKLIAPRTTFLTDMSEEERGVMLAHQDYWLAHLNAGLVVVMGPVADPKGGYGVMIAHAPSTRMLEDWQAQDPAITAQIGFAYENLLMPWARVAPTAPLAPVSSISP